MIHRFEKALYLAKLGVSALARKWCVPAMAKRWVAAPLAVALFEQCIAPKKGQRSATMSCSWMQQSCEVAMPRKHYRPKTGELMSDLIERKQRGVVGGSGMNDLEDPSGGNPQETRMIRLQLNELVWPFAIGLHAERTS